MQKLIIIVLLWTSSFVACAQACIQEENGESYRGEGDICDLVFLFNVFYDRWPNDKKELLAFHMEASRYDYGDKVMNAYYSRQNESITKVIKDKKNTYTVSNGICSFYLSGVHRTIQWNGGMKELLRTYNHIARTRFVHPCCIDKKGRVLWSFFYDAEFPAWPKADQKQFRYITTMEESKKEDNIYPIKDKTAVIIPFTMTRSGLFYYDISYLEGVTLFYQENGKPFEYNTLGILSTSKAIDIDYVKVVKAHMKAILDEYPEIESIKLWEKLLFNNVQ